MKLNEIGYLNELNELGIYRYVYDNEETMHEEGRGGVFRQKNVRMQWKEYNAEAIAVNPASTIKVPDYY